MRPLVWVMAVLSALFILAFAAIGFSVVRAHNDNCQTSRRVLDVLNSMLADAEGSQLSAPGLSTPEAKELHLFYARQFRRIVLARQC